MEIWLLSKDFTYFECNADSSDEEEVVAQHVAPQVISTMELPEGARLSDSEDDGRPQTDPHRALNIDLDEWGRFR